MQKYHFVFYTQLINMAQKPITNRIEFGQNLNPLNDYAGVPAINDDGNLQTLIDKVGKVNFGKQVKLMLT